MGKKDLRIQANQPANDSEWTPQPKAVSGKEKKQRLKQKKAERRYVPQVGGA